MAQHASTQAWCRSNIGATKANVVQHGPNTAQHRTYMYGFIGTPELTLREATRILETHVHIIATVNRRHVCASNCIAKKDIRNTIICLNAPKEMQAAKVYWTPHNSTVSCQANISKRFRIVCCMRVCACVCVRVRVRVRVWVCGCVCVCLSTFYYQMAATWHNVSVWSDLVCIRRRCSMRCQCSAFQVSFGLPHMAAAWAFSQVVQQHLATRSNENIGWWGISVGGGLSVGGKSAKFTTSHGCSGKICQDHGCSGWQGDGCKTCETKYCIIHVAWSLSERVLVRGSQLPHVKGIWTQRTHTYQDTGSVSRQLPLHPILRRGPRKCSIVLLIIASKAAADILSKTGSLTAIARMVVLTDVCCGWWGMGEFTSAKRLYSSMPSIVICCLNISPETTSLMMLVFTTQEGDWKRLSLLCPLVPAQTSTYQHAQLTGYKHILQIEFRFRHFQILSVYAYLSKLFEVSQAPPASDATDVLTSNREAISRVLWDALRTRPRTAGQIPSAKDEVETWRKVSQRFTKYLIFASVLQNSRN